MHHETPFREKYNHPVPSHHQDLGCKRKTTRRSIDMENRFVSQSVAGTDCQLNLMDSLLSFAFLASLNHPTNQPPNGIKRALPTYTLGQFIHSSIQPSIHPSPLAPLFGTSATWFGRTLTPFPSISVFPSFSIVPKNVAEITHGRGKYFNSKVAFIECRVFTAQVG